MAARRELEEAVARAAAADPWMREHPPLLEWWGGTFDPAGTPEETIAALEGALEAATQDPEVAEKLEAAGTVPTWEDAAEVAALWEEREKTAKPVIEELIAE